MRLVLIVFLLWREPVGGLTPAASAGAARTRFGPPHSTAHCHADGGASRPEQRRVKDTLARERARTERVSRRPLPPGWRPYSATDARLDYW
jgi:hypothetical protein